MKHHHAFVITTLTFFCVVIFAFVAKEVGDMTGIFRTELPISLYDTATSTPTSEPRVPVLFAIRPKITRGLAVVTGMSAKVFAYAHGTAAAGDKIMIGMSDKTENPFPPNELVILEDRDISRGTMVTLPTPGDIQTMAHDPLTGRVYMGQSSNGALRIYSFDPRTSEVKEIINTTMLDVGRKPAITTDGIYVYGITDTAPSTVFKVRIADGEFTANSEGHIPHGHAATMGIYDGSIELYFTGGMLNGVEKVDADTLESISRSKIEPCSMTDDMPFVQTALTHGYLYIGCETVPYGIRVKTDDMSYDRFALPGSSLGLFTYGDDLYNAAQDGHIDVFPGRDLKNLHRYAIVGADNTFDTKGQDLQVNEILSSPKNGGLYFTAWWGVKGLYQVALGE